MKTGCLFALSGLALTCASCGNNGLYPVCGRVTCNGEPATGAFVYLLRRGANPLDQQSVMGVVQADGSFIIVCDAKGKGAPPGEYDVLIKWPRKSDRGKSLAHRIADRLKGRYADPAHSPWRVTIRPEANELPPFELTPWPHRPASTEARNR